MKKIKYSHDPEKVSQAKKQEKRQITGKKMMALGVSPFVVLFIWALVGSFGGVNGFFGSSDKIYGFDAFAMIFAMGGLILSPVLVAALIMFVAGLILTLMQKKQK